MLGQRASHEITPTSQRQRKPARQNQQSTGEIERYLPAHRVRKRAGLVYRAVLCLSPFTSRPAQAGRAYLVSKSPIRLLPGVQGCYCAERALNDQGGGKEKLLVQERSNSNNNGGGNSGSSVGLGDKYTMYNGDGSTSAGWPSQS